MRLLRQSGDSRPTPDIRTRTLLVGLGAPKAGTSWLWTYLAGHRNFFASPVKELDVFNRWYPDPFRAQAPDVRQRRIEDIIRKGPRALFGRNRRTLRALSDLGHVRNADDYRGFFADRIGNEPVFGDITPSYALLSRQALHDIATITDDVRFLFIMRDPADRTVSDIRHQRRRNRPDESIDDIIEGLARRDRLYQRSNYPRTLDALAGLEHRTLLLIYEDLFRDETARHICSWLGLDYVPPDAGRRVNAARTEDLSDAQKAKVREILSPVYRDLGARLGSSKPAQWRW